MKLYHYVHCPFCIRVRMTLGYLKIPYESIVLSYDDEETPKKLTKAKMLPILSDGEKSMNESLDIMLYLDKTNLFRINERRNEPFFQEIELLLNELGKDIHSLAMPHWVYTKEFNETSRQYFQTKKEIKRGPFKDLIAQKKSFLNSLAPKLLEVEKMLEAGLLGKELSLYDILIASHLWGLYIVPEFQFSIKLHNYLQSIAERVSFDYHKDLWR